MARRRTRRKYSRVRSYTNTAVKALRIANQVRSLLNVEFKFKDTSVTSSAVGDIPYESKLLTVGQGDTQQTRDGDSIKCKRINVRGFFTQDEQLTDGSVVRVMIVRSTRGDFSPQTNMFDTTGSVLAPLSPKLYENRKFYKILAERVFTISPDSPEKHYFKFNIKNEHQTDYDAGTSAAISNQFYLVAISDAPNAGSDFPLITFFSRAWFVDN